MNELLIIILIIVVVIIFNNLNTKIRKLEKEVSDLSSRIKTQSIQPKTIDPEPISEQTIPSSHPIPDDEAYREHLQLNDNNNEQVPIAEQKDWLQPVFDFLKQNALTIIGIFTLVLGIGYFVKYAIDKNWIGETARAGIGFCTGAGIILTGHFLRKNYATFSSIITGGGIAVLYFTATIAFREYHLFTQNTAFVITTLITLISIVLSYYYKSEILIIFSLLGGFSAPLMISTGQSNYLFLFIYISLLNAGMLAATFLRHWKSVGWTAFIFTTLYLFTWTSEKTELLSIIFYIITYIIFYVFALQDYIRKNTLPVSDILMLALINSTSTIGLVYTFHELKYEPVIIFPLLFACINAILLFREYGKKNFGISYSVFAGITVSLITIAIALQFKTHLITSVWAVEATLLLYIWKKTNQKIFKTCFYILFPLVIIAQILTWTEYFNAKNLSIIVNPVFLTSLVTIISTIINLYLLKNTQETAKKDHFWEDFTAVISYGIIYTALLLEITYHISDMPWAAITHIGLLFSLYYIFIILVFRKKQNISNGLQIGLIYLFLFLLTINATVSTSSIVTQILLKKLTSGFYFVHLIQWIPFLYICSVVIPFSGFHKSSISYWILSSVFVITVSFGLYHLYVFTMAHDLPQSYAVKNHFSILYLPIIWAILASIFIYTGLKKDIQEYNKIGFALIGIMVLKLYAYDVWQMDNISRIIAFIILGIILLISSFTFQRLRNIIKNMVDKKEEKKESADSSFE
ncbi:DUF2339 domain-containing protein [Chryseobacterium sp. G0240]|uniref:DUF2339 domain-containing protein n=1 Tax=Chryseobacterium sp. G0240 TaxID=2487066 RepID=UPI000F44E5D0|nr:DUF2339 domain-containing protein [Chryseobacterium sp. G0240]ROI04671.1 DUF2339 domain-containing protein [Chryseobacterium sp. G0240]